MNKTETINFMGDMLFGDQPVMYGFGFDSIWGNKKYSDIFVGVIDSTLSTKYNVANFEAVIRKRHEHMSVSDWSMCCDENIVGELKKANINIVSIANNHTMDYGREWFDYTVKCLSDAGIGIVGLKDTPYIKLEIYDKKVAIVSASYLNVKAKKDIGYFYNPSYENWEQVLRECDDCDIKVAYLHWGNEFIKSPNKNQLDVANMLMELGVDLIVGHHPHILQQNQIILGKPVVFSLGNFVSDYWQKRLRKTAIVNLDSSKKITQLDCKIDKLGCPRLSNNIYHELCFYDKTVKDSIFINRNRMRIEYFFKILFNFYRIKEKRKFIKWLYRRFIYIIKFFFSEIKNPNVIYEHYES